MDSEVRDDKKGVLIMYRYFISYFYQSIGDIGFGHFTIDQTHRIQSGKDLRKIIKIIEQEENLTHVIILNYKLMSKCQSEK